ncbi:MAG: endopeptidase La [Syntrophales bacterium]
MDNHLMILPLRNMVLFPGIQVPLLIGRESSIKLVKDAWEKKEVIGVIAQKDAENDEPVPPGDLYSMGTTAKLLELIKEEEGLRVVVEGVKRFRTAKYLDSPYYFVAEVEIIEEEEPTPEANKMMQEVKKVSLEIIQRVKMPGPVIKAGKEQITQISHPGQLADWITVFGPFETERKQEILETIDIKERLKKLLHLLNEAEVGIDVKEEAGKEVFRTQRAYWLREQIKAAQKELKEMGETEVSGEIAALKEKMEQAMMPEEARKAAEKELDRLSYIHPASAEYGTIRTYLDWLIEIPWSQSTEDNLDINQAEKILDEDHYNLEKVKKRMLEYLAVRQLKPDVKGQILCFVGPPGTGKTSLGRSIARALGRKFVRISLGGVRDEAEIRGHRRTYVGALPGRIIQQIKKAGSNNPVFMLDEMDKVGADWRGDPSSALLEVLDPEQNFSFSDHYMEVSFDLSRIMFIGTANLEDPILPALKDRMELLYLPGYTREEKLKIAKQFLVPRQLEGHGLSEKQLKFDDKTIEAIIRDYTREAGVRNLEREIAACCRRVARGIAAKKNVKAMIKVANLHDFLGPVKFFSELAERTSKPGVAIGLAWTQCGGEILFIEAAKMEGKEKLILTGQLGDVMKESAQAALSYVRSNVAKFNLADNFFKNKEIHLHVPAGATPKDGPSAGIAMFIALVSLLTNRPTRSDVAMTGEITLRGRVLPVGGIKEKVLAAKEAGLKAVILPKRNEKDLEEVPKEVKDVVEFKFIEEMDEAINMAFEEN